MTDLHLNTIEFQVAPRKKPAVIGLYGLSGCGKTYLLEQLKKCLGEENFAFYDGSQAINTVVPGGLTAFKKLDEAAKEHYRGLAIQFIANQCFASGKTGLVAGHYMLWSETTRAGQVICTQDDLNTYTHIIYLDTPAAIIHERRVRDAERSRRVVSVEDLGQWQIDEITALRPLCRKHHILFSLVSFAARLQTTPTLLDTVAKLVQDFGEHTEKLNQHRAHQKVDDILAAQAGKVKPETMLVLDADKTLSVADTGAMFWQALFESRNVTLSSDPLKLVFKSELGYSYTAFRQATLMYEECATDDEFDTICERVASLVTVHDEFETLLSFIATQNHIRAVVVTCGLRLIWEKVLDRLNLSATVKVIGGGRLTDGFVVTPQVKASLVHRLQNIHKMYVTAFGDSPIDLPMLKQADRAIVVVGEEHARSRTMDEHLLNAIDNGGLQAQQLLLPAGAGHRLSLNKLPRVKTYDPSFILSVFARTNRNQALKSQVRHATDRPAAKVLMTGMRDANVAGPTLREAHRRVGWYLATEFMTDLVGVEKYLIPHVQGHTTDGYRLCGEEKTSIVALMRGGEPMALGVNDAFPKAMFIHAKDPKDIQSYHVEGQRVMVLVDSVVNSGKTVVDFVRHIRSLRGAVRIVVVCGVVQINCLFHGACADLLLHDINVSLVALRLSENKFTGKGTTDTGNRLFNTTHIS